MIENPKIQESMYDKLKMLFDWRLAAVGKQEQKKQLKRKAGVDQGIIYIWYHFLDFMLTDFVTAGSADQADSPEQERLRNDRAIITTYLEKLEAVRIAREALSPRPDTVYDNQLENTSTLFSLIRDGTSDPGEIPRVTRFQAESLLAAESSPPVFVLVDRESHSRRRYKSTADVMVALKLRFDEMMVMDSGLDLNVEDSFSGQPLDAAAVEQRFLHRLPANTISGCSTDGDTTFQPPMNCLDLGCLEYNVKPYPLTQDRYTLLDLLVDYAQTRNSTKGRNAGKTKEVRYFAEDLAGCKAFAIIGQEDAISLTHHDHHGFGTFVEVIDGLKLWVFWPEMSEKDWEEFEDEGMYWMKGQPKWTLLRPGDVLIMGAGQRVPHLVITLKTSTCIGGFFWDSQQMESTLKCIYQEIQQEDLKTTNEGQAGQLVPVLKMYRWLLDQPRYKGSAFHPSSPKTAKTTQRLLDKIFHKLRAKARARKEAEPIETDDGDYVG